MPRFTATDFLQPRTPRAAALTANTIFWIAPSAAESQCEVCLVGRAAAPKFTTGIAGQMPQRSFVTLWQLLYRQKRCFEKGIFKIPSLKETEVQTNLSFSVMYSRPEVKNSSSKLSRTRIFLFFFFLCVSIYLICQSYFCGTVVWLPLPTFSLQEFVISWWDSTETKCYIPGISEHNSISRFLQLK